MRTKTPEQEQAEYNWLTPESIAAFAAALGANKVGTLTAPEARLIAGLPDVDRSLVKRIRTRIRQGHDPLGDAFCEVRSAAERREQGVLDLSAPHSQEGE